MLTRQWILFTFLLIALTRQEFCAVDPNVKPPPPDVADTCTNEAWNDLPPLENRNFTNRYCQVLFLLDLSPDYVTNEEFEKILLPTLTTMATQCLDVGVGYTVDTYPMFNMTKDTRKTCCDPDGCSKVFGTSDYSLWTSTFDDTDNTKDYWQETGNANFSFVFLSEFKSLGQPCLYNTLVLITNRLFDYKEGLLKDFPNLPNAFCTTFSVVLLGRPDISFQSFERRYGKLTANLLQINDIFCLPEIARCIPPCGDVPVKQCNTTITCSYPQTTITTPLPITTSTAVSPCSMCEFVVNQAKFHFNRNESKRLVEMELLRDCESLRNLYGPQAVTDCNGWIRENLDIIYKDLQNGKSAHQICVDMGECS